MSKPVLAIVGINGSIAPPIITAIASPQFKDKFSYPVRLITRSEAKSKEHVPELNDSANASKFAFITNADIVSGKGLDEAFKGTDVVINTAGYKFDHKNIVDAAVKSKVKVYISSEWAPYTGPEHIGDFFYQYHAFKSKYLYTEYAAKQPGLKTISIYAGSFIAHTLELPQTETPDGPVIQGFQPDKHYATTSHLDIGRTAAFVASKALSGIDDIPSKVYIKGSDMNFREAAKLISKYTGKTVTPQLAPEGVSNSVAEKIIAAGPEKEGPFDFFAMVGALYSQGYGNFKPTGNDVVDFKLQTADEYAKEHYKKKL